MPLILIVTVAVWNLFIAIIVNSMQDAASEDDETAAAHDAAFEKLVVEVSAQRAGIGRLSEQRAAETVRRHFEQPL